jgi:argininosuccinate lyase
LGIPFREAHALTGQVVRLAFENGKSLDELSLPEYQAVHPDFDENVYQVFNPRVSIAQRKAIGGTAPEAVKEQIKQAKRVIANP